MGHRPKNLLFFKVKMIAVFINGTACELPSDTTVAAALAAFQSPAKGVAVELNGVIVPRSTYEQARLRNNDRLEVVRAVGGG
jgi:sulfur carrier protein